MRLHRLVAGGAVLVALTGTAACGAKALEPKIALRDAFGAFAENRAGAVQLSIASSADEVQAFVEAVDPESAAGISDDVLELLLSSSFDVAYDLGEDRASAADDSSSVLLRIDDLVAGEVRSVGEVTYARADLDGLAERFPDMQDGLDEFRSGLTGDDGVSEPAPEEILEPATALLEGEWISVDVQEYLEQLEEMSAGAGLPDDAAQEMRDLLGAAVADAVTSVERRQADDTGDHVVATVDLREVYATVKAELPGLYDDATAEALEQQLPTVDTIPDKQIAVSFWLRDGELARAELDLAQFLDEPAGSLLLRADVSATRNITAPEDAVEFDLGALMPAGLAGMPGYETPAESDLPEVLDAYTLAAWLDEDIEATAYDDGGVPSVAYLPDVAPFYDGLAPDLVITAVGERIQVAVGQDVVCLTPSLDGMSEDITDGPC